MDNNDNISFDGHIGATGNSPMANQSSNKSAQEYFREKVRNIDKARSLVVYHNEYVRIYRKTKIALFIALGISFASFFILQFIGAVIVFVLCGAVILVMRVNAEAVISPKVEKIMPYREFIPISRQIMRDK